MLESQTGYELEQPSKRLSFHEFGAESAKIGREIADSYERYHIHVEEVKDIDPLPHRFLVKVGKVGLAKLLVKELER